MFPLTPGFYLQSNAAVTTSRNVPRPLKSVREETEAGEQAKFFLPSRLVDAIPTRAPLCPLGFSPGIVSSDDARSFFIASEETLPQIHNALEQRTFQSLGAYIFKLSLHLLGNLALP
ncbi:hypothetical protein NDU88_004716 [Pleurodeles waltl]|uniref:Uncharacterized protein n=1 Tax=Pleurodeles waltl TaxID=8319 RepID=A0AAV7PDC7_PLEWA|nr:hypothetical protein NDU88_004716 [Pleurodeles waltl]